MREITKLVSNSPFYDHIFGLEMAEDEHEVHVIASKHPKLEKGGMNYAAGSSKLLG